MAERLERWLAIRRPRVKEPLRPLVVFVLD